MILSNYKEYNINYISRDINLNISLDQGQELKKKNFLFLEFFWIFAENDKISYHYNILLLYFFFNKKIYLNSLKHGRSNKVSFYILNFNFMLTKNNFFDFLNFFYFDFLQFFFFLGNKFYGKVVYKSFFYDDFYFFRLFDYNLFFNKRLSNNMPVFFPNVEFPLNFKISWKYNYLFLNKIFNKL